MHNSTPARSNWTYVVITEVASSISQNFQRARTERGRYTCISAIQSIQVSTSLGSASTNSTHWIKSRGNGSLREVSVVQSMCCCYRRLSLVLSIHKQLTMVCNSSCRRSKPSSGFQRDQVRTRCTDFTCRQNTHIHATKTKEYVFKVRGKTVQSSPY